MFKFLKEKLKKAVSIFSKKIKKEVEVSEPDGSDHDQKSKISDKPEEVIEKTKEKPKKEIKKEKKIEKTKKKKEKKKEEPEILEEPEEIEEKEELPEIEEDKEPEEIEQPVEEPKKEKKGFFAKIFKKKEKKEIKDETPEVLEAQEEKIEEEKEDPLPEIEEEKELEKEELPKAPEEVEPEPTFEEPDEEEQPKKKGLFKKIGEAFTTKTISESKFEDLFYDLEIILLENNVAVEVIDKIKEDLKKELVGIPLPRGKITEKIIESLRGSVKSLFNVPQINLLEEIEKKKEKPYIISFVGVNGSGKTTSLAKIASLCQKNKLEPVMVASDTFRAAAIQQLEEHANNLKVKIIKHDYGSDAAAVAYDGIEHARSKGKDVVLIDTAGRLHSNTNLMDELKKVQRVSKPDLTIFVGESITGNDCIEQAIKFNEAVEFDAIILTKADVDEKGGAPVSVSYVTGKPIIFIGTGQEYGDLEKFSANKVIESLGL